MSQIFGTPVAAPHTTTRNSPGRIMITVMLALAPATLYGFWLYGWPAFYLWLITIAAAVLQSSRTAVQQRLRALLSVSGAIREKWA